MLIVMIMPTDERYVVGNQHVVANDCITFDAAMPTEVDMVANANPVLGEE